METLTALRLLHGTATVLLLVSVGLVLWRGWTAWRAGEALPFASTLERPWIFAWLVMGLCLLSFPVSGWWLVHTVGWPLSQAWILGAGVLYVLGGVAWLLLVSRVHRLKAAAGSEPAEIARQRRSIMIIAGAALAVLLVILVLMLTKPL
ncbi:DUF2269 family protein [Pseudomonas sp. nanlin1]|uniref:DUF2269 family protein n=1 Tax=Pseudomonas sp. nanlin1 TaxID=3040605 RepID=UPI00388FE56E